MTPLRSTLVVARSLFTRAFALALALPLAVPWSAAVVAQQDASPTSPFARRGPYDVRIVTLNVADGLCSTADKSEGDNAWTALARIVAALDPDVLLLQEAGDNNGHGTGFSVDTPAALEQTLRLFMEGGPDPFHGRVEVGAFVRRYAPQASLPHIAVSSISDSYNRNALLSRWPFRDLNGDGRATMSDMPKLLPDAWAPGGTGGIRGWLLAEIDLPDDIWWGDLVAGNSHLKAGTTAANHAARVVAAKNMSYLIQHWWNGAGSGAPDPHGVVLDEPPATAVLSPLTPLVTGGDWNEDEADNGTDGPAVWIARGAQVDGDGPDQDGSDMAYDDARDPFTHGTSTQFGIKRDYIAWQDGVALLRKSFIFDSGHLPSDGSATPSALLGFPGGPKPVSAVASDHRPVVVDLRVAQRVCAEAADLGGGTPGGSGLTPRASLCGGLASGEQALLRLEQAAPLAPAWLTVSALGSNPVLPPGPVLVLPALLTDAGGELTLGRLDGGGGPYALRLQWAVLDAGAAGGHCLSNALHVEWLP